MAVLSSRSLLQPSFSHFQVSRSRLQGKGLSLTLVGRTPGILISIVSTSVCPWVEELARNHKNITIPWQATFGIIVAAIFYNRNCKTTAHQVRGHLITRNGQQETSQVPPLLFSMPTQCEASVFRRALSGAANLTNRKYMQIDSTVGSQVAWAEHVLRVMLHDVRGSDNMT